jgi:hypothetical protein
MSGRHIASEAVIQAQQLEEDIVNLVREDYDYISFQFMLAEMVIKTQALSGTDLKVEKRYNEILKLFLGNPTTQIESAGSINDNEDLSRIAALYMRYKAAGEPRTLGQIIADVSRLGVIPGYQLGDGKPKDYPPHLESAAERRRKRFERKFEEEGSVERFAAMWDKQIQVEEEEMIYEASEGRDFAASLISLWLEAHKSTDILEE